VLRVALASLVDLCLPPLCLLCAAEEATGELGLGPACVARLERLDPRAPACRRCGRPNPAPYPAGACPDCAARPPAFARAASAARYDGAVRELLLAWKLRRDPGAALVLGRLLADAASRLAGRFDAIVPVPSHPTREREKGFAPLRELANVLAEGLGSPLRARWLVRVRASPPQGAATTLSRRANVAGAFAYGRRSWISPRDPKHAKILLVDDVFTSGSTARECARALRRAGAREVDVATIGRGGIGPGEWFPAETRRTPTEPLDDADAAPRPA